MINRTKWTVTKWADDDYNGAEYRAPKYDLEANVTGSLIQPDAATDPQLHAPVLDLDFPCELLHSSHEGHCHLYIDKKLTWENYQKLLTTLYEVGLIQKGFYDAAIRNKQTLVRKKGQYKKDAVEENPLHTIRLNEIIDTLKGLSRDMGHKEPTPETTEMPF